MAVKKRKKPYNVHVNYIHYTRYIFKRTDGEHGNRLLYQWTIISSSYVHYSRVIFPHFTRLMFFFYLVLPGPGWSMLSFSNLGTLALRVIFETNIFRFPHHCVR